MEHTQHEENNNEELERNAADAAENENEGLEASTENTQDDIVDLDSLERFKLNGEVVTKEELGKMAMRQSDYTRKTQEIAEERKYVSNLGADIQTLASNNFDPQLVEKFKEIYPEKYHGAIQYFLNNSKQERAEGTPDDVEQKVKQLFEKQFGPHLKDLQSFKQEAYEQKVEAESKWLDNQFDTLSKKYPYADDEVVNSKLIAEIEKARQDGRKYEISEGVLEKIFKADNERLKKKFEHIGNSQAKSQLEVNKDAFDTGKGGSPVGEGRKRMSLGEATENAINQLTKG